jgi:tight adherence protein C
MQAGFNSRSAYSNYLSAKIVLAMFLPMGYFFLPFSFAFSYQSVAILYLLLMAGYFVPNIIVSHFREKRQTEIFKGLPEALDLMIICVAAGLGLDMTFKRVGEELRSISKHLSDEFLLTNMEINVGLPREESYKNMSLRTGVAEVRSLVAMLIQTSKFGTSLAESLRVHSDGMRTKRRQLAEERAAATAVKIMIPLILFIFPALFIVIVGPAGIRVAQNLLPRLGGG